MDVLESVALRHWRPFVGLCALVALIDALALSHGSPLRGSADLLVQWSFDPLVIGLSLLAAITYRKGLRRAAQLRWKQALFYGGLCVLNLTLQSPVSYIGQHLFWVRELQVMFLRILVPVLLLWPMPQSALWHGLPYDVRRWLLRHVGRNAGLRLLGRVLTVPLITTSVFILSFVVWLLPGPHNAAVLDPLLRMAMNATMILSGGLFFWVIFDRRDPPEGTGHGARLVMLLTAILSEVVIGALLTLKPMLLYGAYDVAGRLFSMDPALDEATGGFLIWPPTAIVLLLLIVLVGQHWNAAEIRKWTRAQQWTGSNSAALAIPETAEELWMIVRPKNLALGLSLAALPISVFVTVLVMFETIHMMSRMGY